MIYHSLSRLKPAQKARVVGFSEDDVPNKILEMGIVPGVSIQLKQQAPLDGPMYVEYGKEKSTVMLRRSEASHILVEVE
ncbi:MAG: ferrous iron transport protein A [Flavobacteriaceae bacterium]|jgi:ferrous iron transport protein A|nr:ferrous iron transport protein A [Flavobacteriaceae bacterium]